MSFERKKERAIAILESKNMWRSNYAPLLIRGLWKLGLKIPPLPFAPFWQIAVIMGVGFGSLWGIFMWFSTWQFSDVQPSEVISRILFSGILYGVVVATFHWWRKKVNDLPEWETL